MKRPKSPPRLECAIVGGKTNFYWRGFRSIRGSTKRVDSASMYNQRVCKQNGAGGGRKGGGGKGRGIFRGRQMGGGWGGGDPAGVTMPPTREGSKE